jgi:hypothetical protein
VSRQVSLPEHQRLYRRITAVDQAARQLAITDLATTPDPADAHQPWLAAVDLATDRRLPLWSDDVAVRSIAASKGIATFGTWALITALIDAGLIPDTSREDAVALASEGFVNLPTLSEEDSA